MSNPPKPFIERRRFAEAMFPSTVNMQVSGDTVLVEGLIKNQPFLRMPLFAGCFIRTAQLLASPHSDVVGVCIIPD